jgi:hypothetical protein
LLLNEWPDLLSPTSSPTAEARSGLPSSPYSHPCLSCRSWGCRRHRAAIPKASVLLPKLVSVASMATLSSASSLATTALASFRSEPTPLMGGSWWCALRAPLQQSHPTTLLPTPTRRVRGPILEFAPGALSEPLHARMSFLPSIGYHSGKLIFRVIRKLSIPVKLRDMSCISLHDVPHLKCEDKHDISQQAA